MFTDRTQFIESKICPNLTSVKMSAKTDMHPLYLRRITCTLMLLSNLAEPDWISISCKEKLLNFIVCTKKTITTNSFDINKKFIYEKFRCTAFLFVAQKLCYAFFLHIKKEHQGEYCKESGGSPDFSGHIFFLIHIFDAISPNIIFPSITNPTFNKLTVQDIKITRYIGSLVIEKKLRLYDNGKMKGLYLCKFSKAEIKVGTNIMECKEGGYILYKYLCDGTVDCPNDNSDEEHCACEESNTTTNNYYGQCQQVSRASRKSLCGTNYYMTIQGICQKLTHTFLVFNRFA